MNISTIAVEQETAIQKIKDIEGLKKSQRTPEDDALLSVFKAVRKHDARVINIVDAFRQTGMNAVNQPKLAIAQADWPDVFCWRSWEGGRGQRVAFFNTTSSYKSAGKILVPENVFPYIIQKTLKSPVPHIPANIRPNFHLRNYHILFEVKNWQEYPVDPFLLKRVVGDLYIVLEEWDLTELEASILGSMRTAS